MLELGPIVEALRTMKNYEWERYNLMNRLTPEAEKQRDRYAAAANACTYVEHYQRMFAAG